MKNCIYVLTRGYQKIEDYKTLIERNKSIEQNFPGLSDDNIDYIIFHEGNISEEHQKYIQNNTTIPLKFINVKLSYPGTAFNNDDKKVFIGNRGKPISQLFHDKTKKQGWETNERAWGLNYRHMCEFHFIYILKYLREYKYGLRIDEDCVIKNSTNYFDFFKDSKLKLISGRFVKDCPTATINLRQFCKSYQEKNNLKYRDNDVGGPYTNVFMLDLEYFRNNSLLKKFIEEIKNNQYVIIYRWGDLPLWGEVCNMFLEKDEYKYYERNIQYFHGSHYQKVNF